MKACLTWLAIAACLAIGDGHSHQNISVCVPETQTSQQLAECTSILSVANTEEVQFRCISGRSAEDVRTCHAIKLASVLFQYPEPVACTFDGVCACPDHLVLYWPGSIENDLYYEIVEVEYRCTLQVNLLQVKLLGQS